MIPNPSYLLANSPRLKLLLGIHPPTFRATRLRCEPLLPQTRGEAHVVFEGALSTHDCA